MGYVTAAQRAARQGVAGERAAAGEAIRAQAALLAANAGADAAITDDHCLQVLFASADTAAACEAEADMLVRGAAAMLASGAVTRILRTPAAVYGMGPYRTCLHSVLVLLALPPLRDEGGAKGGGAAADTKRMAHAMLDAVHSTHVRIVREQRLPLDARILRGREPAGPADAARTPYHVSCLLPGWLAGWLCPAASCCCCCLLHSVPACRAVPCCCA